MTTTQCPDDQLALYSKTGEVWLEWEGSEQSRPLTWEASELVTKIVIGTPPSGDDEDEVEVSGDDEDEVEVSGDDEDEVEVSEDEIEVSVPDDLAALYPNLTHLHLWQISNLQQLPELPSKLKCLDVRGCPKLRGLPALPACLEELDVGGCWQLTKLPSPPRLLIRLRVNGCVALEEDFLVKFWLELSGDDQDSHLLEFDGGGCPAVTSIKRIPRSLLRLVLEGCENLRDVRELGEFSQLDHLNLSRCPGLVEIPDIPDQLQYVQLLGSEQLDRFMGQDIGPYDRGIDERPNVAKTLYSRRKFGSELTVSAHAKLLLLGDGRVGKTTLAKRLQWDELFRSQQADAEFAEFRPKEDERFTHKIRFNLWRTKLRLEKGTAAVLNQRAANSGLCEPCDDDHRLNGTIRIWDFGGQEIYHQTHRLFAAEGSVFLILWTNERVDKEKLSQEESPRGVDQQEWREWNRMRSLDYWLDYVRSIRPHAQVALVCTHIKKGSPHPPWSERAPKHAKDDLDCFYVDSLEDACPSNPEYQRLVEFVRRACGREAQRIGIVQPAYYSEVAGYVDDLLSENDVARRSARKPKHLLVPQTSWTDDLSRRHRETGCSQHELDANDVDTITGYLNDAGHIFYLRDPSTAAVLVDQEWATDLMYKLLRPTADEEFSIFNEIRKRGGYFDTAVLEEDGDWQTLGSEAERRQILGYMEECGIIVRLLQRDDSSVRNDHFLATEKWLLPEYAGELEKNCEAIFDHVRKRDGAVIESFSFKKCQISEFEFRSLMAHLGRILGTRGTWFRNGMQAVDDRNNPNWCFQVRWRAVDEAGFLGVAKARLTSTRQHIAELGRQVEEVFAADGSPLARQLKRLRRETREPDELAHCFFREVKHTDHDVAVSSNSADERIVRPLVEAMKADGLRVAWYQLDECRKGENIKVMKFMELLSKQSCILLFLSDAYLQDVPETNWFCVWELADAILQMQRRTRPVERTLICYSESGKLDSGNMDRVAANVLKKMGQYFRDEYAGLIKQDRSNRKIFGHYQDRAEHLDDAADHVGDFFRERGTLGTYSRYTQHDDGSFDFAKIIHDVRVALGSRSAADEV